ncbi:hypothetical protein [Vogesella sp. XCS3]|uniref:hypothetical protein n=1 Tax=Vogesella sp. XCS3 TaxID=2877939 RepID=UPI001D0B4534|nr:hypothetical protein [Vogesella sp. XCS3]UDM18872.1 hypothetical protein LCH97_18555 [Vogesella sp. XCS3]
MPGFDELMAQYRDQAAKELDPNRSTVAEEIDAMDWQLSELARLITDLERQTDRTAREFMANSARRHLDTLVQRVYRAKLISLGQRVTKQN